MAKVRLSPVARAELASIDDWGARQFGQLVADNYAEGFRDVFRLLADNPEAGPERPDVAKGLRSFRHRSHIVFYRYDGTVVEVARVLHHAQDVRGKFRR